jgi:hypothetical protein
MRLFVPCCDMTSLIAGSQGLVIFVNSLLQGAFTLDKTFGFSRTIKRVAIISLLMIVTLLCLPGCGKVGLRDSPKAVSYAVDANTSQLTIEWSYFSETLIRLGPLVAEELVMIMDRFGVVTALDRVSGEIVWQYESGYPVGVVSPATPKWLFHDDKLIFSVNSEKLVALNYQTGEMIWETRFPKKVELPSMAIVD